MHLILSSQEPAQIDQDSSSQSYLHKSIDQFSASSSHIPCVLVRVVLFDSASLRAYHQVVVRFALGLERVAVARWPARLCVLYFRYCI